MPRLGDPWEELEPAEIASPEPGPGTLRIRVEATDLNFADILQCRGSYQVKRSPPFTPGMNAAGTVIATAPDAAVARGTRVVGPTVEPAGGFAEEALVAERLAHPIPDGVGTASAMGAHITHGTAWLALHHRARLQPGETVLVLAAAGGVGSAAVEMPIDTPAGSSPRPAGRRRSSSPPGLAPMPWWTTRTTTSTSRSWV